MMNASSPTVSYADAIVVGRVPALPVATARALYANAEPYTELRRIVAADAAIRSAIRIASPSLYGSLSTWLAGGTPKNKRTRIGILGYVLRMATRCTPFGLFASVGAVDVAERTTLCVPSAAGLRITVRPDTRWVYGVHSAYVQDARYLWSVEVVANDLVVERGDALYVMDAGRASRVDIGARTPVWRYDAIHVRTNNAVRWLRAAAASPTRIDVLVGRTAERFRATPEIAFRLIRTLLEAGVLTMDRPSLLGDPLAELGAQFAGHPEAENLGRSAAAISEFAARGADGLTVEQISALDATLQRHYALDTTAFGVDAAHDFSGALGSQVLDDAALLAAVMLADGASAQLEPYLKRYIERYESLDRLIPLLELVDDDFILEPEGEPAAVGGARERILAAHAAAALRDGRIEAELDAADFDQLFPGVRGSRLTQTCEIGFMLGAAHVAAIDAGDYRIVPTPGASSDGVGKSTGRVAQLLGPAFAAHAQRARALRHDDGAIVAELDYVPLEVRTGNLITRQPRYAHAVADSATRSSEGVTRISPADILIGVENGRFVAYSAALGARLEIVESYLLETGYFAPPYARFLAQIAHAARRTPRPFNWGNGLAALPFLPRLRFGRVVLAVARWIIPHAELLGDEAAVRRTIATWRSAWRLPRWVYLTDRDVKLLLDLDSPLALELLRDQVPKYRGDVLFEEMLPGFDEVWLERDGARIAHEFVASFAVPERPVQSGPQPGRDFEIAPPPLAPGSDWTFIKIYTGVNDIAALARDVVPHIVAGCADRIDSWFFLRYHDPAHHIRLRLHAAGTGRAVIERAMELIEPLVASGRIARYTFDTYRREPERFGGRAALAPVERLFALDSRRVVAALAERDPAQTAVAFALCTLAPFLSAWFRTFDLDAWLGATAERSRNAVEIDYDLVRRMKGWLDAQAGSQLPDDAASIVELAALERAGQLTRPSGYVLGALVHVHCNRAGVEYADEPYLEAHLWRALRSVALQRSPAQAERVRICPDHGVNVAIATRATARAR